jgi:hypothetical protein
MGPEMMLRSSGTLIIMHHQWSRAEALHPTVNIAMILSHALVVIHMAKAALCILAGATGVQFVGRLNIQMHLSNIRDSGFNRYSVCLKVIYTSLTVVVPGG